MRIKKVTSSGISMMHYAVKQSVLMHQITPGNEFFNFMKHVSVTMEMDDISTMELFYLKKFASDVKILSNTIENFVDKKAKPDIHAKVEALLELRQAMMKDSDVLYKMGDLDDLNHILPLGCSKYSIMITFSGSNITALTGANVKKLFENEEGIFEEIYYGDAMMENRLAGFFYQEFYQYMSRQIRDLDLITSFCKDKLLYKYCDSPCNLGYIHSPFGEISWLGNTQENLSRQLGILKKRREACAYDVSDLTYVTFVCRTTLRTFMNFYLKTPYVVDHSSFKLEFTELTEDVLSMYAPDQVRQKYSQRISDAVSEINGYRKQLAESETIDLNKFNFFFYGNYITYSIQIPMTDLMDLDAANRMLHPVIFPTVSGEKSSEANRIRNSMLTAQKIANSIFSP